MRILEGTDSLVKSVFHSNDFLCLEIHPFWNTVRKAPPLWQRTPCDAAIPQRIDTSLSEMESLLKQSSLLFLEDVPRYASTHMEQGDVFFLVIKKGS